MLYTCRLHTTQADILDLIREHDEGMVGSGGAHGDSLNNALCIAKHLDMLIGQHDHLHEVVLHVCGRRIQQLVGHVGGAWSYGIPPN